MRNVKPVSMFALLILLPVGTASSGVLTWSLFGNIYGGLVFLGLFVVGVATENWRQMRCRAGRAEAGAEAGKFIARLHDAARESGVDVSTSPRDS